MNAFHSLTYAQSLSRIAHEHATRDAIVFRDQRYTFAELKTHVDEASARLASIGLKPGDKVAILLPNRPEFIWYWFGASQMGLVTVMLNTRLRRDELAYQLAQSDSRAVIVPGSGAFRDFLAELSQLAPAIATGEPGKLASEELPELCHVIAIDRFSDAYNGVLDWSSPPAQKLDVPPMEMDPAKAGMIGYSSGTTALPKGAMISHCVWRKAWDLGERMELTESDCIYMSIPMFGSMANMNGVLPYLVRGAKLVIGEQFDADVCLRAIEKERVTGIHLLPAIIKQLVEHPDFEKRDRSSLRIAYTLSIDPAILDIVADVIGVPGVVTGYGLTETATAVTRNHWTDSREYRHGTQGWAEQDIELKIVDPETLADIPPNQSGEIWVRGYCVMIGYYKKPKETADMLRSDGWLRTGDVGQLDNSGRLKFEGRLGDGYKSRGFNVSPEEIEHIINQHSDVELSSVVGVPGPLSEKIGVAFVIKRPNALLTERDLLDYLRPKIAGYKMPVHVFFTDEFPLTTGTDKVRKVKLRELATEHLNHSVIKSSTEIKIAKRSA